MRSAFASIRLILRFIGIVLLFHLFAVHAVFAFLTDTLPNAQSGKGVFYTSEIEKASFLTKALLVHVDYQGEATATPSIPETGRFIDPFKISSGAAGKDMPVTVWQLFTIENNAADSVFYLFSRSFQDWTVFLKDGTGFRRYGGRGAENADCEKGGRVDCFSIPVFIEQGSRKTFLVKVSVEFESRINGVELMTRHYFPLDSETSFPVSCGPKSQLQVYSMQIASRSYYQDGFRPYLGSKGRTEVPLLQLCLAFVLAILCIYTLIICLQQRKKVYLYYWLFQVFMAIPFLYISYVRYVSGYVSSEFMVLPGVTHDYAYVFYFLFVDQFLKLGQNGPVFSSLLRYGSVVALALNIVVASVYFLGFPQLFSFLYNSVRIFANIAGIIAIIWCIRLRPSLYGYVIAGSLFLVGLTVLQWLLYVKNPDSAFLKFPLMETGILLESMFLLLGLGAYSGREERKREKLQNDLIDSLRHVQRLQEDNIRSIVSTQESERSRISRDMHDEIGAKLSTLKMMLVSMVKQPIRELVAPSVALLDSAIGDMRNVISNLSPKELEDHGYLKSVEELVNRIRKTESVEFELSMHSMNQRFAIDLENTLYRITQELINNSLKHAAARKLILNVMFDGEWIKLQYEDDGVGFDTAIPTSMGGYGLNNINTRARMFQGEVFMDTSPGRGFHCEIRLKVPNSSGQPISF